MKPITLCEWCKEPILNSSTRYKGKEYHPDCNDIRKSYEFEGIEE